MPQMTGTKPVSGMRLRLPRSGRAARPGGPDRPLLPASARLAAVAVAGACVAITVALGVATAHQTHAGVLDRGIDHWLQTALSGHLVLLDGVADCGAPFEVTLSAAVVLVVCLAARWVRGALLVAAAVGAGALGEYALKPLFDRTLYGFLSYPSGHTIGAFSLAVTFAVLLTGPRHPPLPAVARWLLSAAGPVLACGVAVAQVARDKHYFTDTVGGAAVAIAVVLLVALAIDAGADRLDTRARR